MDPAPATSASAESEPTKVKKLTLAAWENQVKEKYESFWLYPESHPWRLAQHITLRGIFLGANLGFLGGIPFTLLKRRGRVLTSLGTITFRGAAVGGILCAAVSMNRLYSFDKVGIEDRSYRISYNWGQTRWDYYAYTGGVLGGTLLWQPFGGILPAVSVGIALGNFAYFGSAALSRPKKQQLETA